MNDSSNKNLRRDVIHHEWLNEFLRTAQRNIANSGFHITRASDHGHIQGMNFCYTTGLTKAFGHPEIVVFGLDLNTSQGLLLAAIDQIRNGVWFKQGPRYARIAEVYEVAFRTVPEPVAQDRFPMTYLMQPGENISFLQLVWPDAQGLLPWENGADQEEVMKQPVLSNMQ